MRVLDIDLDLFVNEPAYWCAPKKRLSSTHYKPWKERDVRQFLEKQCGLSTLHPIRGVVVEHHHEAFYAWKSEIENGRLSIPFDVVHPDSHADLGLGDAGWPYLMGTHLHRPVSARDQPQTGSSGMNAGNYLAFAIACRWIRTLTYVHHPKGGDDLMTYHFKDFDANTMTIELKKCLPGKLHDALMHADEPSYDSFGVLEREPEVPFEKVDARKYVASEPFDFLVLARSSAFTPKECDKLIPIVQEYMSVN